MASSPKRTFLHVPAKNLAKFISGHNLTIAAAAKELGLSPSAVSTYINEDYVPVSVDLAVKYLDDGRADPDGVKHYLLTTEGEQVSCKFIGDLEEITIGGNRYKMVPI